MFGSTTRSFVSFFTVGRWRFNTGETSRRPVRSSERLSILQIQESSLRFPLGSWKDIQFRQSATTLVIRCPVGLLSLKNMMVTLGRSEMSTRTTSRQHGLILPSSLRCPVGFVSIRRAAKRRGSTQKRHPCRCLELGTLTLASTPGPSLSSDRPSRQRSRLLNAGGLSQRQTWASRFSSAPALRLRPTVEPSLIHAAVDCSRPWRTWTEVHVDM